MPFQILNWYMSYLMGYLFDIGYQLFDYCAENEQFLIDDSNWILYFLNPHSNLITFCYFHLSFAIHYSIFAFHCYKSLFNCLVFISFVPFIQSSFTLINSHAKIITNFTCSWSHYFLFLKLIQILVFYSIILLLNMICLFQTYFYEQVMFALLIVRIYNNCYDWGLLYLYQYL